MDLYTIIDKLFYEFDEKGPFALTQFDNFYLDTIRQMENNYFNIKMWTYILHAHIVKILQTVNTLDDAHSNNIEDVLENDRNRVIIDFGHYIITSLVISSIPGALRMLAKVNVIQLYQELLNRYLSEHAPEGIYDRKDPVTLSLYFDALANLVPYLKEYYHDSAEICHQFHYSKLWAILWNSMIRFDYDDSVNEADIANIRIMYIKFLRLSTAFLYGLRGTEFMNEFNEDKNNRAWRLVFRAMCNKKNTSLFLLKLHKYVADLLLISYSDRCLKVFLDKHSADLNNVIKMNLIQLSQQQPKDVYNQMCYKHIETLDSLFLSAAVDKILSLSHKISSLNYVALCPSKEDSYSIECYADKMMPRLLPCFNRDCDKIFHLDNPSANSPYALNFKFCETCGIPSYCSDECRLEDWESLHKYYCVTFAILPSNIRFKSKIGQFISFVP